MNYAFAAKNVTQVGETNFSAWDAILHASLVVQLVLLILAGLSILCWAVFFYKNRELKLAAKSNHFFSKVFWEESSLDAIFYSLSEYPESNMARIFGEGYQELKKMADLEAAESVEPKKAEDQEKSQDELAQRKVSLLSGMDNLERAVSKAISSEINVLENGLGVLATTGSTGPFIGLFGTVWGIMGAFQKIGVTGVASLASVAPGISEALIATAVGLAAAIPATVAYNYFVSEIKRQEVVLNNFGSDFLSVAKRNFFKRV